MSRDLEKRETSVDDDDDELEEDDEDVYQQSTVEKIVYNVHSLIGLYGKGGLSGSGTGNKSNEEDDLVTYKCKTKALLEQLLIKLEEDVEEKRLLEEQIELLENDLKSKDYHLARELRQRHEVENVVKRLQRENARLQSALRLHLVAEKGSSSASAAAHMADLKTEVDDLKSKLNRLSKQRELELHALTALAGEFEKKVIEIEVKRRRETKLVEESLKELDVLKQKIKENETPK